MKILVAGGAGYIGSHVVRVLLQKGFSVVIVDNLSKGHKESVPQEVKFYQENIGDSEKMEKIFSEEKIDAVMHFANFIEVGESMSNPMDYYFNNVVGAINLFNVMLKFNVNKIIFSSSAAIFGIPKFIPITEEAERNPINVYGKTKLFIENILFDYDFAYGLKSVCLRYFNACGAGYEIGEVHNPETHLIPLVLQVAIGKKDSIKIFGTDYNTKDGTCVRDYVHVLDLAEAHILALEKLFSGMKSANYNLGNGEGYSVREIIETVKKVTGKNILLVEAERREGDPDVLVADSTKIKNELGWKPKFNLNGIIESAWKWHKENPDGFDK